MEKKTIKKPLSSEQSKLPQGYYIAVNGKFHNSQPLSKKEAINLFNTIKSIMEKSEDRLFVGYNTIGTSKVAVEIIDSEFLDERLGSKSIDECLINTNGDLPIDSKPVVNPPVTHPPFVNPPVYTPPSFGQDMFRDPPFGQDMFRCMTPENMPFERMEDKKQKFFNEANKPEDKKN